MSVQISDAGFALAVLAGLEANEKQTVARLVNQPGEIDFTRVMQASAYAIYCRSCADKIRQSAAPEQLTYQPPMGYQHAPRF